VSARHSALHVAVIGCGIGGLATALALHEVGADAIPEDQAA